MRLRTAAFSLVTGVVVFALAVVPVGAIAREDGQEVPANADGVRPLSVSAEDENTGGGRQEPKQRLSTAKKRVCEAREAKINAIMTRRSSQAAKHLQVFTKIYERVTAFYEDKGRVAPNYDALKAAVDAAKTKADASVEALKASPTFSCDDAAPKDVTNAYKQAYKAVREDLKVYRTAIKDLIVAVKSAQGDLDS